MDSKILWFTGLSGSGKTTISNSLKKDLLKKKIKVLQVDGDIFRRSQKKTNKFTKLDIKLNNFKIIEYIFSKKKKYDYILVSVISPLEATRKYAKKIFGNNYYEFFVNCKIKTLKKRDTKGLYAKADSKIIKNLIGYKSKIYYEKSKYKTISINTDRLDLNNAKRKILKTLN
tara:strand:+ start:55 stop:570 length:516 start_codon:yes stop_codon:yes gene_type:complete